MLPSVSPEFNALHLKYAALKEKCARQLESYNHLIQVECPNIQAIYMMQIGQLEHQVFELKVEINRWKRRFTLRQIALNNGNKPDYVALETKLDVEFAEYVKEIRKHIDEVKEASALYHAQKLSEQESAELRTTYLNAIKKLHPDINPDLPPTVKDLWNQIQNAYAEKDWQHLKLLAALVDSVISGEEECPDSPDGIARLRESCDRLAERSDELAARINEIESAPPYTYSALLDDSEKVARRQAELDMQISVLNDCIHKYEELWNNGK